MEAIIRPDELYYLGSLMKADLIDYSYIKNVTNTADILNDLKIIRSLSEKGIIEMNFVGEAEVDPEIEQLLKPIFFGHKEIRFLIDEQIMNIHEHNNQFAIVFVDASNNSLKITEYDAQRILSKIQGRNITIQTADINKGYQKFIFSDHDTLNTETQKCIISIIEGGE